MNYKIFIDLVITSVSFTDDPEWIEVLTELLLGLLSRPSQLNRKVVNSMFSAVCTHLTPTAFQIIMDVSIPSFLPPARKETTNIQIMNVKRKKTTKLNEKDLKNLMRKFNIPKHPSVE